MPSPYIEGLAHRRDRDARDNASSRAPESERLRLAALWGVEIYGPSDAEALSLSLERLGWNQRRLFGGNENPGAWIREQRMYGWMGSLNLGFIERPGQSRFIPRGRTAPLPDGVDHASGWVCQLSPSTTAIILRFSLDERASAAYERELMADRETSQEPLQNGYRSYGVEDAKRRAIDGARAKARAMVVKWFAECLPGLFSRASDGNRLPTAELITTATKPLLVRDAAGISIEPRWHDLLIPYGHREVWALSDCEGLAICWPGFEGDLRHHAVIHMTASLVSPKLLEHCGEQGDLAYEAFVGEHAQGALLSFAPIAALKEINRRLRMTPSSLSASASSRGETVRCLEAIREHFDWSVGIPSMISELVDIAETSGFYRWQCADFRSRPMIPAHEPMVISEAFRSRARSLASRARALEAETRAHLEQLSAVLSTRESMRAQARMELVAIGAAIVSLVSLGVAVMSVDRLAALITQGIERLWQLK